jgi:hypothetical protein
LVACVVQLIFRESTARVASLVLNPSYFNCLIRPDRENAETRRYDCADRTACCCDAALAVTRWATEAGAAAAAPAGATAAIGATKMAPATSDVMITFIDSSVDLLAFDEPVRASNTRIQND